MIELQNLEKEKKQLRSIAHDLNNILLSTLHSISLLKQKSGSKDELVSLINIIESNTNRAADIIEGLLSSSDASKLAKRNLNVSRLLNEVIIAFSTTLPRNIKIKTDIESGIKEIWGSRTDIYRVIMNLLVNAKEAISGTGVISISLRNVDAAMLQGKIKHTNVNQFVEMTIIDNGKGIEESNINKIFEENFSTKDKGRISGIGLNIVEEIIKDHSGQINVSSKIDEGTKFTILFPAYLKKVSSSLDGNQKTVLVAEDDQTLLKLLSELLESYNYKVIRALDGYQVIDYITQEGDVDLLIIDKKMPKLEGIECIRKIREIKNNIPVILSSGSKTAISDDIIDELKIEKILNKPYNFEEMLILIEELVG